MTDFSIVTEAPDIMASREQLAMLLTRYDLAARHSTGRDVLEVGCGAGLGLGYLAMRARRVVGGEYTDGLLRTARGHYGRRIPLVRLDAQNLPFPTASFDLVLLYETIYYLPDAGRFMTEAYRVLRAGGMVIVCTANREWVYFNPSPFSTRYYTAVELVSLLVERGFRTQAFGAFSTRARGVRSILSSVLKRAAVAWGLMPKTMRGKELLKRVFFGPLTALPSEVQAGIAHIEPLTPLDQSTTRDFKVIYLLAEKA